MRKPILVTENDIGITKEIMIKDFIVEHKFVEPNEGWQTESLTIQNVKHQTFFWWIYNKINLHHLKLWIAVKEVAPARWMHFLLWRKFPRWMGTFTLQKGNVFYDRRPFWECHIPGWYDSAAKWKKTFEKRYQYLSVDSLKKVNWKIFPFILWEHPLYECTVYVTMHLSSCRLAESFDSK